MTTPSHNPFRNAIQAEAEAARASSSTSEQVTATDNGTIPRINVRQTTDPPPFSESATPPPRSVSQRHSPIPDFSDELPPAYTPTPDPSQGEASVEFGPRRPFQSVAAPAPQSVPMSIPRSIQHHASRENPLTSLIQQLTGISFGPSPRPSSAPNSNNWSSYPGFAPPPPPQNFYQPQYQQPQHQQFLPPQGPPPQRSVSNGGMRPPPPPRHPSSPPRTEPPALPARRSDFARDFYAAGPVAPETGDRPPQPPSQFAPPPGPPPNSGHSRSASSAHLRPDSAASDGRPTEMPVAGHPLLNSGNLLVYPAGYLCDKCENIGYKNGDPDHPCGRCWSKYSRHFSGALKYSPWTESEGSDGMRTGSTFQRPLPQQSLRRSQSHGHLSPMPGSYAPSYVSNFAPPPPSNFASPQPHPSSSRIVSSANPPSGAVVYPPGDARLGGRLCPACGGRGRLSFLMFEETCGLCNGIGRIYK